MEAGTSNVSMGCVYLAVTSGKSLYTTIEFPDQLQLASPPLAQAIYNLMDLFRVVWV